MSALITKDEYGVLLPVNDWNLPVFLPDKLSTLLELAADSMEGLDRNLYHPTSEFWHKGANGGDDGLTRVNYAGAVMVARLGVKPEHGDVSPDDFETEREPYAFLLKAIEAASARYDLRDAILLVGLCEEVVLAWEQPDSVYIAEREDVYRRFDSEAAPGEAGVIAKWNQYASQIDMRYGYGGWSEADKMTVVMREMAHDAGKIGW